MLAALVSLTGCASELTAEEIAELEDQGPYVGDDEVASTAQALSGVPASIGYFWADDHTRETVYQPSASYSFNSEGGANTVDRLQGFGDGRYLVTLGELSAPGNAQVTAYGTTTSRCNVRSRPENVSGNVQFEVGCFTAQGVPVNSQFIVFYNNTGETSGKLAMAYVGGADAVVSDIANVSTATKEGTGRYRVYIPHSVGAGVPFATARSTGANFCHPSATGVELDHGGWFADVRCFNKDGLAADTSFYFTYMNLPSFTQIESSVGLSESTSDNYPGGWYTSTNSTRVVYFNYEDPTSLWIRFYWTGVFSRSMSLVNAFTTSAHFCKPAGWASVGGDHFETSVVCHDVSGTRVKKRVSNAFFGVGP